MKIAILSFDDRPEPEGMGAYAWHQSRALARLGHDVHLFAGPSNWRREARRESGMTLVRPRRSGAVERLLCGGLSRRLPVFLRRLERGSGLLHALRVEQRRGRFDVVELLGGGSEGLFLNLPGDTPTVLRLLLPPLRARPRSLDDLLAGLVERLALQGARALVADSHWLAGEVRSRIGTHRAIQVIPPGIDLSRFDADEGLDIRERFGLSRTAVLILCASELVDRAGAELLLQAAEALGGRQDALLLFAGKDPENRVEEALAAGRLSRIVPRDRLEARALLKQSDIFLFPDRLASCPFPVLEAMAAGRAIVASDCGGLPELLRPGLDGLLARTGEAASFGEALAALVADRALRLSLGRSARLRVEARFTAEEVARRSLCFWAHTLGAPASPPPWSGSGALEPLGPANWFQAWWLTDAPARPAPVLERDAAEEPMFGALCLDELRFVLDVLAAVYWDAAGRGGSPEARFLEELAGLYRERASAAAQAPPPEPALRLALPGLAHPFFRDPRRCSRFVDTLWRIHASPGFPGWLEREVAAHAEELWASTPFRRLAVLAAELRPSLATFAVLRTIYRDPGRREQAIALDQEFFSEGQRGAEFKARVETMGLHAALERPRVFAGIEAPVRREQELFGPPPPAVTVLIPAFRHERFVGPAIASALGQSWPDLRLLVVDDCSPDRTVEAARAAVDGRGRIEVNHERLGLGRSIAKALERIDTPFVALLNSDDLFHPDRIARCMELLGARTEIDLVATGLALIDEEGGLLTPENVCLPDLGPHACGWVHWYAGIEAALGQRAEWTAFGRLLRHNHLATSSNIVCRTAYLRAKVGEFQGLRYCVDWVLFLLSALEGRLAYLSQPLLGYRLHAANTVWFKEGGRPDYILEVNRVLARVLAAYADQAGPALLAEKLAGLLLEGVAGHGEADGLVLFLAELLARTGQGQAAEPAEDSVLAGLLREALARKQVESAIPRGSADPWELVARAAEVPRLRVRAHAAELFIERSRRLESEAARLGQEAEEARQAAEDAEALRGDAAEQLGRLEREHAALGQEHARSLEEQARLAAALEDAHREAERVAAWAQSQAEEATRRLELERGRHAVEALEAAGRIETLQVGLEEARAALALESERLAAARQEAAREASRRRAEVARIEEWRRQDRLARYSERQELLRSHEWRAGRLLLRKCGLLPVFKTLDRAAKFQRVWLDRLLTLRRPRLIVACPGAFPCPEAWHLPFEVLELAGAGLQTRILCWEKGPAAGLGKPERAVLKLRRLLRQDRLLQALDRKSLERRSPAAAAELAALLGERAGDGRLYTFVRSAERLGAAYLHGFGLGPAALQVFAASRLLGAPFGLSIAGPDLGHAALPEALLRVVLREAALLAADSRRTAEDLERLAGAALEVVVKPPAVRLEPPKSASSPSGGLLASIGPVVRRRDLFTLAQALRLALDRGADLRLELLGGVVATGEGLETADWLRARIQELGLQERFLWTGDPDPERVRDLLSRAAALVATAVDLEDGEHEGVPPAVEAAMAAGLPVIASRAGSLGEALEAWAETHLVPAGDAEALAARFLALAADPRPPERTPGPRADRIRAGQELTGRISRSLGWKR